MSMNGLPNPNPDPFGANTGAGAGAEEVTTAATLNTIFTTPATSEPTEFELELEELVNSAFHFDELTGLVKPYVLAEHFRQMLVGDAELGESGTAQDIGNSSREFGRKVASVTSTDLIGVATLRCNEVDYVRAHYGQEYSQALLKIIAARLFRKPGVPGLAAACRVAQSESFLLLLAPTLPPISVVSQLEEIFKALSFLNLRYLAEQLEPVTSPGLFGKAKERESDIATPLSFSMGIALYPCDGLSLPVLQERAEKARQESFCAGFYAGLDGLPTREEFPAYRPGGYPTSRNSYAFYTRG